MASKQTDLEIQIDKIYSILNEIQKIQKEEFLIVQKNQKSILAKIEKLQEYNEIDDMMNAVIDKHLRKIEQKLKQ